MQNAEDIVLFKGDEKSFIKLRKWILVIAKQVKLEKY